MKKHWTVGTLLTQMLPEHDAEALVAGVVYIVHRDSAYARSISRARSLDDDVTDASCLEVQLGQSALSPPRRIVIADEPWFDWGAGADFS